MYVQVALYRASFVRSTIALHGVKSDLAFTLKDQYIMCTDKLEWGYDYGISHYLL